MLRPALLLPPERLLTPRYGLMVSAIRLGPATGRSDAYPDGYSIRWFDTTFTARHGIIFLALLAFDC